MIIIYQRFIFDWVPFKLDIDLEINYDNIDFSILTEDNSSEANGFLIVEKTEEKSKPKKDIQFDQTTLQNLISIGIPELGAKNALINTNHNENDAIEWYFNNIGTDAVVKPLESNNSGVQEKIKVNKELVNQLLDFGFLETQAKGALIKFNNNIESASDFLFNNGDFDYSKIIKENEIGSAEKTNVSKEINKGHGSVLSLQCKLFN